MLNRIQPDVPRQSGEVKSSKLGMFRPLPPIHRRCLPRCIHRAASGPLTGSFSMGSEFYFLRVFSSFPYTFFHSRIGFFLSKKHARIISSQYAFSESLASRAMAPVPKSAMVHVYFPLVSFSCRQSM